MLTPLTLAELLRQAQEVGRVLDRPEGVAKLVGHASGQLAEDRQPFLSQQLALGLFELGGALGDEGLQQLVPPPDSPRAE